MFIKEDLKQMFARPGRAGGGRWPDSRGAPGGRPTPSTHRAHGGGSGGVWTASVKWGNAATIAVGRGVPFRSCSWALAGRGARVWAPDLC